VAQQRRCITKLVPEPCCGQGRVHRCVAVCSDGIDNSDSTSSADWLCRVVRLCDELSFVCLSFCPSARFFKQLWMDF